VDRHEHIGKGFVGLEPFRRLLNDERFASKAILIETEKAGGNERAGTLALDPYDKKNLATLRRLRKS
jgi:deoxyribonuclease-4